MFKVIDCRQIKSGNNKPGNSRLYDNQEKSAMMTERHEKSAMMWQGTKNLK